MQRQGVVLAAVICVTLGVVWWRHRAPPPPPPRVALPVLTVEKRMPADPAVVEAILKGTGYPSQDVATRTLQAAAVSLLRRHAWDDLAELCAAYDTCRGLFASDQAGRYSFMQQVFGSPYGTAPPPNDILPDVDAWVDARPDSGLAGTARLQLNAHRFASFNDSKVTADTINDDLTHELDVIRKHYPSDRVDALEYCDAEMEASIVFAQPFVNITDERLQIALRQQIASDSAWISRALADSPHARRRNDGLIKQAEAAGAKGGDSMFALCFTGGRGEVDAAHWPRLRQGLQALMASDRQDNRHWANYLALYAIGASDWDTAKAVFDELGHDGDPSVWPWPAFENARLQAEKRGSHPRTDLPPLGPRLVPCGAETAFIDSPDVAEQTFDFSLQELFHQHRFAELEAIASAMRKAPNGPWAPYRCLDAFYEDLGETNTPEALDRARECLAVWHEEFPDSVTEALVEADVALNAAWMARGGGYADTVTDKGWQTFHEQLQKAADLLARAKKAGCRDARLPYLEITVGMGQDADPTQVATWCHEAQTDDPQSRAALENRTIYLLPRWHGSPQALRDFADEEARRLHSQAARGIIGAEMLRYGEQDALSFPGFSWTQVRDGLKDWIRQSSGWYREDALDRAAQTAQRVGDMGSLRTWLAGLGPHVQALRWAHPALRGALMQMPPPPAPHLCVLGFGNMDGSRLDGRNVVPHHAGTFGVAMAVRHLAAPTTVEISIKHPRIVKPDGQASTEDVLQLPLRPEATTFTPLFTFDPKLPYEWVPGTWTFESRMGGHVVATQTFTVR